MGVQAINFVSRVQNAALTFVGAMETSRARKDESVALDYKNTLVDGPEGDFPGENDHLNKDKVTTYLNLIERVGLLFEAKTPAEYDAAAANLKNLATNKAWNVPNGSLYTLLYQIPRSLK